MNIDERVLIAENIEIALSAHLAQGQYSQLAVLVDKNTRTHCLPLVHELLGQHVTIEVPSGEEHKNMETCSAIWQTLTAHAFDRKGLLINLGGGVIGDMGGFCAATYKRGIRFVNIPTTLLAQVDASVGGKLGIDFMGFKNHIGLFQEPEKVLISPGFLQTLPRRELYSGYAEVLKHALITDKEHWQQLHAKPDSLDFISVVTQSVQIKQRIVMQDPEENGLRKILNFGHTIGHAVESYMLEKGTSKLLHGEAIAVGIVAEAYLSAKKCGMPQHELEEIEQKIMAVYGYIPLNKDALKDIASLALQDKKNEDKKIKAVLLDKIGEAKIDVEITAEEIVDALIYYQKKAVSV